ncbi:MAG: 2-oxoglutarate oxidoreductase [Eubacterium sp.]|nr:2-oxoglutarate oxidoreductase [Eubacterium sp.]
MKTIYKRPEVFTDAITTYCGGCGHGIINKLIAELVDEMGFRKNGIICWPIGCSCLADAYYDMDLMMCLHGRAPAVSTGMKRADPSKFILCYQGDGDMVSEGMAEIMHAAIRGEKFTVLFVNNAIYGMTGGQMAPTTLIGQKATTAPYGRMEDTSGYPVQMAELMATMPGVYYSERVAVNSPQNIMKAKKAMKKAFELQMEGKGLTFVEILSMCPTGWSTSPVKATEWVTEKMMPVYPLGVKKDMSEEA